MSRVPFKVIWKNFFKTNLFGGAAKPTSAVDLKTPLGAEKGNGETLDPESRIEDLFGATRQLLDKSKRVTEFGDRYKKVLAENQVSTDEMRANTETMMRQTIDRGIKDIEQRFDNIEFDKTMNIVTKTSNNNNNKTSTGSAESRQAADIQKRVDELFEVAKQHLRTASPLSPDNEQKRKEYIERINTLAMDIEKNTTMSQEAKSTLAKIVQGLQDIDSPITFKIVSVAISGLSIFDHRVLYAGLQDDDNKISLARAARELLTLYKDEGIEVTSIIPEDWTPHITLAKDLLPKIK
eukprot:gene7350-8563_t